MTDGPFTETKELIGGYAIVRAASDEEAVAMARRTGRRPIEAGGPILVSRHPIPIPWREQTRTLSMACTEVT